jgi:hypothetical protein
MSREQETDGTSTNEYVVNRGIVPSVSTSHELDRSRKKDSLERDIRVLTDPFRFIAWNDVDQAYEIKRVLPMDNEKGPGLAVEI